MKNIKLQATDDSYRRLRKLMEQTQAGSIAEVIAYGVALLEHHVDAVRAGNEIHIVYPADVTRSTRIIMPYEGKPERG